MFSKIAIVACLAGAMASETHKIDSRAILTQLEDKIAFMNNGVVPDMKHLKDSSGNFLQMDASVTVNNVGAVQHCSSSSTTGTSNGIYYEYEYPDFPYLSGVVCTYIQGTFDANNMNYDIDKKKVGSH